MGTVYARIVGTIQCPVVVARAATTTADAAAAPSCSTFDFPAAVSHAIFPGAWDFEWIWIHVTIFWVGVVTIVCG